MLTYLKLGRPDGEKGATAILVALVLVLLMGIAAVAIDLGFGFNERRQSQTAADMAVMAGATEIVLGGTQEDVVREVLIYTEANVNAEYTIEEWRDMWMSCRDPERLGFDVGTGTPVDFQPLPAPSEWGGGQIECISSVASYLRVRIPDQIIGTNFARVMGFDEIRTSASAVARIEAGDALGSVIPLGVEALAGAGHICLSTGSHVYEPCKGNSSGSFGAINGQFYGDYFGNRPVCATNMQDTSTLPQNIALGIDHAVAVWPAEAAAARGVHYGDNYPGENVVQQWTPGIGFDRCKVEGGAVVPFYANHTSPPNALFLLSGNDARTGVFQGLLQSGTNPPDVEWHGRLVRPDDPAPRRRLEGNGSLKWDVNNSGLWDYLRADADLITNIPQCDPDAFDALGPMGTGVDDPVLKQKVGLMTTCLQEYEETYSGNPNAPRIFIDEVGDSPRLVWAPQFWFTDVSSSKFMPVSAFRLVFISGMWIDCAGNGKCSIVHFPDEATTSTLTMNANLNKWQNGFEQLSAFLVPVEAVPEEARPPIPGEPTAHTASLFR